MIWVSRQEKNGGKILEILYASAEFRQESVAIKVIRLVTLLGRKVVVLWTNMGIFAEINFDLIMLSFTLIIKS